MVKGGVVMRAFVKTVLAFAVLVGVAVTGINVAAAHAVLRPYVHPIVATFREFFRLDPVVAVAKELLAWPTPAEEGAGAADVAERRVPTSKTTTKAAVKSSPKEGAPEVEVVQLPAVVNPPKVHRTWTTVCVPGGAYYVPKEVFDTKAVCDDPSLGVPVEEGPKLGWEGIEKRVAEIRERYLAQQGASAAPDDAGN